MKNETSKQKKKVYSYLNERGVEIADDLKSILEDIMKRKIININNTDKYIVIQTNYGDIGQCLKIYSDGDYNYTGGFVLENQNRLNKFCEIYAN